MNWEEASKDINDAVIGTRFGFDEAATAAAQLATSGAKFGQDMPDILKAIGNAASMANVEFSDMSHIFTTMASNGRVYGIQLQQMSTRGINATKALADYLGKSETQVREMVSKGKVSFTDFYKAIKDLNICPVSISYEYDPCDYLKAREMQLKRDNPRWRKTKRDDVESMATGIHGRKGRVVYRLTPSINPEIDVMLAAHPEYRTQPHSEQAQHICDIIDRHIHMGYEIFDRGTDFEAYIESRIALIDIPNKDEAFLREKLYEMYNNPVINHQKAVEN